MGEVHLADDVELNRTVALKEIQAEYADRPDLRARFQLEAEVTGRLEHPGIVPVYGLGCYWDGRPYYAMRLIKGESLHEAIQRFHAPESQGREAGEKALALRELLGRFVAVCNAVAYAHSRGVVHRDLKPRNVMLGAYGETLVVDWGVARILSESEIPSTSRSDGVSVIRPVYLQAVRTSIEGAGWGTPAYMAPEQRSGDVVDTRTDIYLLGGILFEILTGQPPHPRGVGTPPAAAHTVHPGAPIGLSALAARALSPDRLDRPQSAEELARDVERWLAEEPLTVYRAMLARLEEMVAQAPEGLEAREELARNRVNLGLVLRGMNRHADSEQSFRAAVGDYEELVKRQADQARLRADLGTARVHLAQALRTLGRTEEASLIENEARKDFDRLLASSRPHDAQLASVRLTILPGAERAPLRPPGPDQTLMHGPGPGSEPEPTPLPPVREVDAGADTVPPSPSQATGPPAPQAEVVSTQFTLTRELARGGMASIWLGTDHVLNREVAVKIMYPSLSDATFRARFLMEAQLLAQLEHSNICPIYGTGTSRGNPFLVMRYIRGQTLHDAIQDYHRRKAEKQSTPADLVRLLRALVGACRGVAYAHSRGVIHRDPKPANILVSAEGEAIVIDWGLGKVIASPESPARVTLTEAARPEDTQVGGIMGTPRYMAPEMARGGASAADARTDIFILGAVLFDILTGEPPWSGTRSHDIIVQIATTPPPRPRDRDRTIPAALDAICARAMARAPEDRYPSADALADDLEHWIARPRGAGRWLTRLWGMVARR
jgi:serine/threonine protein kinase